MTIQFVYSQESYRLTILAMKKFNTDFFDKIDPTKIDKSNYRCGNCGKLLDINMRLKKCPFCGKYI